MKTTFDLLEDHVALKARVAALEELVEALRGAIENLAKACLEATTEFHEVRALLEETEKKLEEHSE